VSSQVPSIIVCQSVDVKLPEARGICRRGIGLALRDLPVRLQFARATEPSVEAFATEKADCCRKRVRYPRKVGFSG